MKPSTATSNPEGGLDIRFCPDHYDGSFVFEYNGVKEVELPTIQKQVADIDLARRIIVEARPEDIALLFEIIEESAEVRTFRTIGKATLIGEKDRYIIADGRTFTETIPLAAAA